MKFKLEPYHRDTPPEQLIEDIRNVAKKMNKDTVTMSEYEQYGKFHPCTLTRRFGSWFKVLETANLNDSRSRLNIPDEELFKNIEKVWISLGRQPKYQEMKKPLSKYSAGTYDNRFGSYRKALEKFIDYINSDIDEQQVEIKIEEPVSRNKQEIKHSTKREISERIRFRILMRDGFTCKKCGRSPLKNIGVELHVDHIIPWSKGGETKSENLETKCEQCNLGKGNAFNV